MLALALQIQVTTMIWAENRIIKIQYAFVRNESYVALGLNYKEF